MGDRNQRKKKVRFRNLVGTVFLLWSHYRELISAISIFHNIYSVSCFANQNEFQERLVAAAATFPENLCLISFNATMNS